VLRILIASAALLGTAAPGAETAPPKPAAPARAAIYSVSDPSALAHFDENPGVTRAMTDRLIAAVTGERDMGQAWRTLVRPTDRVGIKVSTAGGTYRSSHRGVLASVVAGLERAGVPRSRVIIWDRHTSDLRAAGFSANWSGVSVRGIDPPRGLDPSAKVNAPILGKLIWGDVLFRGKRPGLREIIDPDAGLSSESHLPLVLTRDVTRIINIATIADDAGCGIAGALYNLTVNNVDNNRRFSQPQGAFTIPDVYMDERIAPKVALHIVDGLVAQYAGGPEFQANYSFAHSTLYASKDPVALDSHALRLMEGWRVQSKLPPIGRRGAWLADAQEVGAGIAAEERIDVIPAPALP
jgi:hypothetical protein